MVAIRRRSSQGAAGTMVVGASTRHRAAIRRISRSCDGVTVDLEVCHKGSMVGTDVGNGISLISGNHGSVFRPVHEGVTRVGYCRQGAVGARVVHAGAFYRAAFGRVGSG